MPRPHALQLYSVRDELAADPRRALARVKAAGYDHVELAGTAGLPQEEFAALLGAAGLRAVAAHLPLEALTADPAAAAETARCFGVRHLVMPWTDPAACARAADWVAVARALDAAGAFLRAEGVTLGYHNHDHEIPPVFGGNSALDLLMENSDPAHLTLELDLCWAAAGGADPAALLRRHTGRVPLVHVKDSRPGPGGNLVFTPLGRGTMCWDTLLPAAEAAGAEWLVVEQDTALEDAMAEVAESAAFLRRFNEKAG